MIAEEGSPEYVIPTDNDARAVTLLRSLLSELSSSAKKAVLPWLEGEDASSVTHSRQPVIFQTPAGFCIKND